MTEAFLSLGSNIDNPERNIIEAIRLLSNNVMVLKTSTVYLTEPLLNKSQHKFHNCVIKIQTDIEPQKLKTDVIKVIERKLGRRRSKDKYESRAIDIDLIAYGNLQLTTKDLVIPDPEIEERPFLAIPLYELEPKLILPAINKPIKEVAKRFESHHMVPLREYTEELQNIIRSLLTKKNP